MRAIRLLGAILALLLHTHFAAAQDVAYVQVEARPTLAEAEARVRDYAGRLPNVVGFALGSGWYAIALGPYSRADAERLAVDLRASRAVPADSFVVTGDTFRAQYWPVGAGVIAAPLPLPGASDVATSAATEPVTEQPLGEPVAEPVPETLPVVQEPAPVPDETRREAQASEALLTADERKELQVALQWAGFYQGAIDGAYGPGTRGSMAAWQEAKGYDATGVLTTRQRAELLAAYNAVLEGLDIALVTDARAGIEMLMPTGAVAFDEYSPPFARYAPVDPELPVELYLISQPGDQTRFFGLYELLQTLEIIPTEGPRSRERGHFVIEGTDSRHHAFVEAFNDGNVIKGFALIWVAGDEERFSRLLGEIRGSFTQLPGVLDASVAPAGEDQSVDLVSGLAIRKPLRTRSGFYVDGQGTVLTTSDVVAECREVTIGSAPASVVSDDGRLAVLRPASPQSPLAVATFQSGVPLIGSEVAVAGFPFGDALTTPALTFGTLADIRGLEGEDDIKRLAITVRQGDAGGPVFDETGSVLGMLLPGLPGGPALPPDVAFVAETDAVLPVLEAAGVAPRTTADAAHVSPERLTRIAGDVTVLVGCWE